MKIRFLCLGVSLSIIVMSIYSLVTVSKIVAFGGPSYAWEFAPPALLLVLGIVMFILWGARIFWCARIGARARKEPR